MTPELSNAEPEGVITGVGATTTGAPLPSEGLLMEPVAGPSKLPKQLRRLFATAPFVSLITFLALGVTNYYSAIQVQGFDAAGKESALSLISALSAIGAMVAQPLIGVLSDRTRSRFGRRRPWMLVGLVIAAVALLTAGLSTTVAALTVAVIFVQFGFNALGGPLSTFLPERVPERFRGRYSTFVGLGTLLGGVAGSIFGAVMVNSIPTGYAATAGLALLAVVVFVLVVKEPDNRGESRERFVPSAFLKAFWVNPVKNPDFFWGFTGRILLFGSYSLLNTYSLYIAQDYVGLTLAQAQGLVPLLGLASLPGILIGSGVAGPLSDRLGRRKPLVLAAGFLIVVAAFVPIAMPTVTGMFLNAVIIGFGFGTFIAVDQALMSSVLPNPEQYGKDIGVLNIASTLPNVIGPAFAGLLFIVFGNYLALYVAVVIVATLGALAVLPIKKVR